MQPDPDALDALASRVEALDGPDRMIDGEILKALEPWRDWHQFDDTWCYSTPDDVVAFMPPPSFTGSLDAAKTLVPEHHFYGVLLHSDGDGFYACCPNGGPMVWHRAATEELARTAAALRARAAEARAKEAGR